MSQETRVSDSQALHDCFGRVDQIERTDPLLSVLWCEFMARPKTTFEPEYKNILMIIDC
jgi:hypothetical protein